MKNQLTTIAALPGSGSGCQSALPAEKPMERARPHRDVTVVGTVVGSYFGLPSLGGMVSPIIGSSVDPEKGPDPSYMGSDHAAALHGEKAPDPLDDWFQPIPRERETVMVNVITGTTTTTAQALQIAEQIMRARNREARPKSYVEGGFVLGDPIPARRVFLCGEAIIPASSPDLLDAAGGGE